MGDEKNNSIKPPIPKALLVSVCLDSQSIEDVNESLNELELLADTAGIKIVKRLIQPRKKIDPATYVGKGFIENIKEEMEQNDIELLIFDNELSPAQGANIYKKYKITTLDRTEVILNIFNDHAKTKEAKLQVKLARLKYELPRLKKMWTHLDRERGTASGSRGTSRGMGEKQIEVDRRKIRKEIRAIEKTLDNIMKQKKTQRKQRKKIKKVCLVGYTNAGKSSLFKKITNSDDILIEDKLFATLDSTARILEFEKGKNAVLSDTVGFISNLPHNLIASFRATLKDVIDADLLLHVIDVANKNFKKHIDSVNTVLMKIKAEKIPQIIVCNKIDKLEDKNLFLNFNSNNPNETISISALTGENTDILLELIDKTLHLSEIYNLFIPFSENTAISKLHKFAQIIKKEYTELGVNFNAILNNEDIKKFNQFLIIN